MTIKNLLRTLSLSPSVWRGAGVALLFFAGSSGLMAQSSDPFGTLSPSDYYGNMSMTVKVLLNEVALTGDAVVAVYSGDELRGKATPNKRKPELFYLTIYGNSTGEPLHFKVYTGGRVIETDPGLTYSYNGVIGKPSSPYIVTLPAPVVTTPSTEGWATTCVPFNAEVPDGVTVWNVTAIENNQLVMTKTEGNILPKDTPVLLQSEGKVNYEWLSRVADGNVKMENSILVGTTAEKDVTANSVMTLGHSNDTGEIGFWLFSGTTVPANRAYIADFPTNARGYAISIDETTTTAIQSVNASQQQAVQAYDLQGRRLSVPEGTTAKGTMVKKGKNGQLIIIR